MLEPGTRLGRYAIRSLIGTGGMGEVYLAADTSLGRSVAIKTLPHDIAADPLGGIRVGSGCGPSTATQPPRPTNSSPR
jgi:serine/threonine protein kinase